MGFTSTIKVKVRGLNVRVQDLGLNGGNGVSGLHRTKSASNSLTGGLSRDGVRSKSADRLLTWA